MKLALALSFFLFLFLCRLTWMPLQQLAAADRISDQSHSPVLGSSSSAQRKDAPLWVKMADTALALWNSSGPGKIWNYERGTLLYGIQRMWVATSDVKYFQFLQNRTDDFLTDNGSIPTYKPQDYTLDSIRSGVNLLFLYKYTQMEKYRIAATLLREQLRSQPRTHQGGYWHKLIYPWQMWLDGLFMAEPFRAEYALLFNETYDELNDIAMQFIWMEENSRDNKTGLLYHGWDESRLQAWANPITGTSSVFWGRALGWYAMALVDVLDFFPLDHPKRDDLVHILQRLALAVAKVQDPDSTVWWQVLDQGGRQGNYLESSVSCMFVYALAKGVHKGYLLPHYLVIARIGYEGIKAQFIQLGLDGGVSLTHTVATGGLGGTPYRNGTYEYYISEKVVTNDPKGIGPFLLASLELWAR
ncbi:hypothetical protein O6H91_20G033400 [Diphasiastrum complanatum]|uniref:Uncharacterized protein n=1 Tax=Diphasiastrum complanatum TaxID=34168 RepID=A0ACC2AP96_DIPCM|nr:hypothetical protein O6H91_Y426800 [Diphasiastrum complanatum]KAJ7519311.1 hypothetical protein O6H91_20G033400 [Diphasiastrum complanatum]